MTAQTPDRPRHCVDYDKVNACGPCRGKGYRRTETGIKEGCDFCGGTGARYACFERDCCEYGCSLGLCYVPPAVAKKHGLPL